MVVNHNSLLTVRRKSPTSERWALARPHVRMGRGAKVVAVMETTRKFVVWCIENRLVICGEPCMLSSLTTWDRERARSKSGLIVL